MPLFITEINNITTASTTIIESNEWLVYIVIKCY